MSPINPPTQRKSEAETLAKKIFDLIAHPGLSGPNPHRISDAIEKGANIEYIDPATGMSLLDCGIVECLKELGTKSTGSHLKRFAVTQLIEKGARLGPTTHADTTIAHLLVVCGDTVSMKKLAKAHHQNPTPETDLNRKIGTSGLTPLHLAIIASDINMTEVLLQEGADIEAVDNKGRLPLMLFDEHIKPEMADKSDIDRVRKLLGPDNPRVQSLKRAWENAQNGFPMECDMNRPEGITINRDRPTLKL
jgi:hypothetical protein